MLLTPQNLVQIVNARLLKYLPNVTTVIRLGAALASGNG